MNNNIDVKRYDELLAKEERLRLLEAAIRGMGDYDCMKEIKKIFGLQSEAKDCA